MRESHNRSNFLSGEQIPETRTLEILNGTETHCYQKKGDHSNHNSRLSRHNKPGVRQISALNGDRWHTTNVRICHAICCSSITFTNRLVSTERHRNQAPHIPGALSLGKLETRDPVKNKLCGALTHDMLHKHGCPA